LNTLLKKTKIQKLSWGLLLISLFFVHGKARSQTLDFGVFGGGVYYLGDINPNLHFAATQPAFGGLVRYNLGDRWGFRGGINQGKLKADDADFYQIEAVQFFATEDYDINDPDLIYYSASNRGLNFETDLTEINFLVELNFFPYFVGSVKNTWTPYIFGGAAMYLYNPHPIGHADINLRDLGTEGQGLAGRPKPYSHTAFAIPFGIGFKFSLGKNVGLGIEWGMRKTFNDYIDDISTTYYQDLYGYNPVTQVYYTPDPNNPYEIISQPINDDMLASDPTFSHKKGEKRGDEYNSDWYNFFGFTLTFKINLTKDNGCRDFNRDNYY